MPFGEVGQWYQQQLINYENTIDRDRKEHSPYQFGKTATRFDWSRFFLLPIAAYCAGSVACTELTNNERVSGEAKRQLPNLARLELIVATEG